MPENEYHHYIPRFILKTFSDNFLLKASDAFIPTTSGGFIQETFLDELLERSGGNRGGRRGRSRGGTRGRSRGGTRGRSRGGSRGGSKRKPIYHIKVYRVQDQRITLDDVGRAYGIENIYRDITAEDSMMFEKLLAELECTAAVFVRRIWSGEDISLTRTELADFKKFLAIMMYRGEHRRKQYFEDRFDFATRMTIKKHMRENNISKIQDVWFENLKWIIKTPIEDILKEFERAHGPMDPFAIMVAYRGPIHAVELLDFGYMVMNTVCIWHAEEGSEFILSNTSFGSFEGDMGVNFHSFFVVSPEYAVVLISRLYMNGQMEMLPLRKSWFGKELRAFPDAVYMNENPKSQDDFTKDDVFKYRRIVVPKQKVYLVNSILLDSRDKYITYKSSPSMYKSLLYYDKHKGELFHNQYDYSILKRKVFAEMNRTHSA